MISNVLVPQDLYERIDKTRYTDPLEDCGFQYGFNSTYLKKVVSYWRNEFDWKKQVAVLNKYPHFKTRIEGTHNPSMVFLSLQSFLIIWMNRLTIFGLCLF